MMMPTCARESSIDETIRFCLASLVIVVINSAIDMDTKSGFRFAVVMTIWHRSPALFLTGIYDRRAVPIKKDSNRSTRPGAMKLIGLHAHLQNAQRFKGQVGVLLRHLKKLHVEVVFIDAPYPVPGSHTDFTWVGEDSSLAESRRTVLAAKAANPDAVGLLAFSMGAMLALHIAARASSEPGSPFAWVKLVVAAAAPWPPDRSPLADGFPCRCETPVLFVIGRADQVSPPELQRRYIEFFPNADVFEHDGGHYIPGARGMLQPYTDFFAKHADIAGQS
jgi:hypothetical protein